MMIHIASNSFMHDICNARCSERVYAACKFKNRVAYYPFDDHSAPSLMLIEAFCRDVVSSYCAMPSVITSLICILITSKHKRQQRHACVIYLSSA